MDLPTSVQRLIDTALQALHTTEGYALLPIYRANMYHACGAIGSVTGHQCRSKIALVTARHVLPLWQEAAEYTLLDQGLTAAEQRVGGLGDRQSFKKTVTQVDRRLRSLATQNQGQTNDTAFFVGFAVLTALDLVYEDTMFRGFDLTHETVDAELGPDYIDTAGCAAAAVAGGLYDEEADLVKRRTFWEWWLSTAVPTAWE